jgi:eukaryotic-like serine/threonine-protein kinase
VIWYPAFVAYQRELAERVRSGKAANYAVRLVDAFEQTWGGPTYFQAYEFVENGGDLQQLFDEERELHQRTRKSPLSTPDVWAKHVTWAKVFMAGISALHESKIVHADLKPPNAYLIRDPSIGAGYQLKLIDMDFSLLADKKAPWHGYQGYVGSDNYRSPEHMTKGAMPTLASDVFTCGLILYELLAGVHPYWREDQAEYAKLVRAHAAKPPLLAGHLPAPASNNEVSTLIHRALSPDPAARPTAADIRLALSGRTPKPTATTAKSATTGAPRRAPLTNARIQLKSAEGRVLQVGVRTELGKHLAGQLGADAIYWDAPQCVIERGPDGTWRVTARAGTANETLLNGEIVTESQPLHQGDVLAVGRKATGISKLPLTISGA